MGRKIRPKKQKEKHSKKHLPKFKRRSWWSKFDKLRRKIREGEENAN